MNTTVIVAHIGASASTTVALLLALVAFVAVASLVGVAPISAPGRARVASPGAKRVRWLWAVCAGAMVFQLVHMLEHLVQLGHWMANPQAPPYLTPWAAEGRDGLAVLTDGTPSTGNEVLHLLGNLVFLGGLVAAGALVVAVGIHEVRWLRAASTTQGLHVVEHAILTMTALFGTSAIGFTNLFGLIDPRTSTGAATRVWVHFALNLTGTVFALLATREIVRNGWQVERRAAPPLPAVAVDGDGAGRLPAAALGAAPTEAPTSA